MFSDIIYTVDYRYQEVKRQLAAFKNFIPSCFKDPKSSMSGHQPMSSPLRQEKKASISAQALQCKTIVASQHTQRQDNHLCQVGKKKNPDA